MFTTYYEYEKAQINSRARKNFLDESGTDSGTGLSGTFCCPIHPRCKQTHPLRYTNQLIAGCHAQFCGLISFNIVMNTFNFAQNLRVETPQNSNDILEHPYRRHPST